MHEGCEQFLKFDNDTKIPLECLCNSLCESEGCARKQGAADFGRHKGSYRKCLCGKCSAEDFCFPLLAPDEAAAFVSSLSQANFAKLCGTVERMMKCYEARKGHPLYATPIPQDELIDAVKARIAAEGGD